MIVHRLAPSFLLVWTTLMLKGVDAVRSVSLNECTIDYSDIFTSGVEEIRCTFFVTPKDARTDIKLYGSDCSSDPPTGMMLVGDLEDLNEDISLDDTSKKTLMAKIDIAESSFPTDGEKEFKGCVKAAVIVTLDEGDVVMVYEQQTFSATLKIEGSITQLGNGNGNGGIGGGVGGEITKKVEAEEKVFETKTYSSSAVQCNSDGTSYNGDPIEMGGSLFVCFTADSDDAFVSQIESFTITKGTIVSKPVSSAAANGLTQVTTTTDPVTGRIMLILSTRLIADFFAGSGALSASGQVTVKVFDSTSIAGGLRDLQEQEQGDDAGVVRVGFNLDVKIKSNSGPGADSAANNGRKTAVSFAAMIVAAGVFYFI